MASNSGPEIRKLIDRGLVRYGQGDLNQAIVEWEAALRLEPTNAEARQLVEFVRQKLPPQAAAAVEVKGAGGGVRRSTPGSGQDEIELNDWDLAEDTDPESPESDQFKGDRDMAEGGGTDPRRRTVPSPIPEFLAPMTAPDWTSEFGREEGAPEAPLREENTRRIGSEPHHAAAGRVLAFSEGSTEDSASAVRVRAAELVDRCRTEFERGKLESAVALAEEALREGDRAPPPGISEVIEPARPLFERVLTAFLGPPASVLVAAAPPEAIAGQDFDHRAGFLLSRIDGVTTLEQLLDIAGMPRFEALRILTSLLRAKALKRS